MGKYLQQVSDLTTSFDYSVLAASAVKSIMNSKIKLANKFPRSGLGIPLKKVFHLKKIHYLDLCTYLYSIFSKWLQYL